MEKHANTTTMGRRPEESSQASDSPQHSADCAPRTLGTGLEMLPNGATQSDETASSQSQFREKENYQHPPNLGDGIPNCAPTVVGTSDLCQEQRHLGLRLETETHWLETAEDALRDAIILKPSEVVRLLNSTHYGTVLNERQLHRHRNQAPHIQDGKRIDLWRYTAWLVFRHHLKRTGHLRPKNRHTTVTLAELRELLIHQEYRCALTGELLTPENFALDHIVPLVDGGDFSATNSQLVLKTVNRAKHTMNERDFIEMCCQVAHHRANQ